MRTLLIILIILAVVALVFWLIRRSRV